MKLLPTPTANDAKNPGSPALYRRKSPNITAVALYFPTEEGDVKLLPTPTTTQRGPDRNIDTREGAVKNNLHNIAIDCTHNDSVEWGEYEPAIRRAEITWGRPAPDPTEPNSNGRPRLTAAFDEWHMGWPAGWVDDAPIPYGAKLKICGNGVVPQQADLALDELGVDDILFGSFRQRYVLGLNQTEGDSRWPEELTSTAASAA
ncbi:hypothetical protein HUN08_12345 [Gordonia sp. X0973]|uniref:hypothetical protein n=1 Tax=Gordonia sp. X0973 TaxID=2742602 RepID=UPI00101CC461|nr:hypothetical protein [Gordonia sp. X0973]QKT07885.1 hypothetical protein HUN08_12345 [Gordonia sp. X0973]